MEGDIIMDTIGTIVGIIIGLIYIVLFCFPAFMFVWEGSESYSISGYFSPKADGIGCYGWICIIVGFPGAIIGLIASGVRQKIKNKGT